VVENARVSAAEAGSAAGRSKTGLSNKEIIRIVNRYIGVEGGYLGDFSYRTHADFYPEYCDLEIDPYQYEGTTRERFIAILSSLPAHDQAKVVRAVIERFPVGGSPLRTEAARDELLEIVERLESGGLVPGSAPALTSDVVLRAIGDAEALLQKGGPTSAVDRVHTSLHGHLRYLCDESGVVYATDDSVVALFKKLRQGHPKLRDLGPRGQDIEKILNACSSILDALNPVRNRASVAHPNEDLLGRNEAQLVINVGRSLLSYLDGKLGA
jgi:hypothetical protein